MGQSKYLYPEFSGALQQKSTTHIKKPNEVLRAKNADFATVLGAFRRRKGAQSTAASMPKMPIDTPPLGAFIARFPTAIEIWAAQNDDPDSPTEAALSYFTGPAPGDWTEIEDGITTGAEVNMVDDLDEIWVSNYDPALDAIGDPFTVNSSHSVSTTRLLDFAPKARFYIEFAGSMWAANVLVTEDIAGTPTEVRYRDRIYKSSGPMGVFAFVRAETTLTQTDGLPTEYAEPLEVDSVRYVKPGQIIDVYQAGTETKLYTLTVESVDKALDTVTFGTPDTLTFANTSIDTSTDQITITNVAWPATGMPITFWDGGGTPTNLADGGVYYVIRVDSTHIRLATSRANALANTYVDIGSQGTGTHRVTFSPVFGNKDEFWRTGRKNKLSRFWNSDYRNPEASDFIKLPASFDSLNDVVAVGSISSRLFIFTANSMFRFDGQNLVPLRNDVGCAAHRSIGFYDTFMVWLDSKGKIWIRNEEAGEQDIISEAIQETLDTVPQSQLSEATAVCVDDKYKLYLGQVEGKSLRVVYNFRTNQWTTEWFTPHMPIQLEYTFENTIHPHFFDETGQMWVDEEGDDDNGTVIHMEVDLGDDNFGVDELKNYHGIKVYSENSAGSKMFASVDKGEFKPIGQITRNVQAVPLAGIAKGALINFRFTNSASGDAPQIEKAVVWYTREEDTFRATER